MTDEERKQFLADCVREGLEIDPETAEVDWAYVRTLDPYGIYDLPEELQQTGRGYFARRPGGTWVCFYDLPAATRDALWQKHEKELVFPAGLGSGQDDTPLPPEVVSWLKARKAARRYGEDNAT
jgi:hypothetical protein